MGDYEAAAIIGGWMEPADYEEYLAAASHLVESGLAWRLEGSVGRLCADLIAAGEINPPAGGKDYWGNRLPTTAEGFRR